MQKLKMKVTGYDASTGSLLVCFASDATASDDPSEYQPVAFQPAEMWPDLRDIQEIKLEIAKAGAVIAERQALNEALTAEPSRMQAFEKLIGETTEYTAEDLAEPVTAATPLLVV